MVKSEIINFPAGEKRMRGNFKSARIRLLGLMLLFLITASGVFAYSAAKSPQAKPILSAETALKAIDFAAENDISIDSEFSANLRQTINFNRNRYYSPALGRFISKDPIGFNGGNNLYRYADNNPMRWVDPWGLIANVCKKEYKDLVVRVLNYYDKLPFHWNDYVLRTAFEFFKGIPNGPELKIFSHYSGGNAPLLGTTDRISTSWNLVTDLVFNSYRREDNDTEKLANIVISNTNWGSEEGARAGLTDRYERNQALVAGNNIVHQDPLKLGWTVAHETGHIILGLKEDYAIFNKTLMTPGAWLATSFNESQIQGILTKLKK